MSEQQEFVLPSVILASFNYPHETFEGANAAMIQLMEALGAERWDDESGSAYTKTSLRVEYSERVSITYSIVKHPEYGACFRLIIPGIGNIDIGIKK